MGELASPAITFHHNCGAMVTLSHRQTRAERRNAVTSFNNAVVMTSHPLLSDKLFEISIEGRNEQWQGSLDVGVTTLDPSNMSLEITNLSSFPSRCWVMSGNQLYVDGKEINSSYGEKNLNELTVGDRVGIMRKADGSLHFYINGADLGKAATGLPENVFGVVDLYGRTTQVAIVQDVKDLSGERCPEMDQATGATVGMIGGSIVVDEIDMNTPLLFHSRCGLFVKITNQNQTAMRPHALHEFNNAITLTNRPLKDDEVFEVVVDAVVPKWSGSLEIGLTVREPHEMDFPSTATGILTGTVVFGGRSIVLNGVTIKDDYPFSTENLKVGDTIGVSRSADGTVRFFYNGLDLGVASTGFPGRPFGLVDLYGRIGQVSIHKSDVAASPFSERFHAETEVVDGPIPQSLLRLSRGNTRVLRDALYTIRVLEQSLTSRLSSPVYFDTTRHGRNVKVSSDGRRARRMNPETTFNHGVVLSARPLRDDEKFEFVVDKVTNRWTGSVEIGVIHKLPEQAEFPWSTVTDIIDGGTWVLSGSYVLSDHNRLRTSYRLNLDDAKVGTRLGICRTAEGCLHFYKDGVDQGVAAEDVPGNVFAFVDLYGKCTDIRIAPLLLETQVTASDIKAGSRFFGSSLELSQETANSVVAKRKSAKERGFFVINNPLADDERLKITLKSFFPHYVGSLSFGLATELHNVDRSSDLWNWKDEHVRHNAEIIRENYAPSLLRLTEESCVGLQRRRDGTLHFYLGEHDLGVAAIGVPQEVYAFIDMPGPVEEIHVEILKNAGLLKSCQCRAETFEKILLKPTESPFRFDECLCGKAVELSLNGRLARRTRSFNQAVVVTHRPLLQGQSLMVKCREISRNWKGSLKIGFSREKTIDWNKCVASIEKNLLVYPFIGEVPVPLDLTELQERGVISIDADFDDGVYVSVNRSERTLVYCGDRAGIYVLFDVYGKCQAIEVIGLDDTDLSSSSQLTASGGAG